MSSIECEICGKDVARLIRVKVEEAILHVCVACQDVGEIVVERAPGLLRDGQLARLEETTLISGYGRLIRRARARKRLTREQLAKQLGEKASVVRRIEEERMLPDERLTKKLESLLGIKLRCGRKAFKPRVRKRRARLTVGDVVELA